MPVSDYIDDQPFAQLILAGLTGAVAGGRFVGFVASGAPASGTFILNDLAFDVAGKTFWLCTVAGSPGTWSQVSGASGLGGGLLAATYYNPSGGAIIYSFGSTLAAVDTTHMRVTFTAPASGNVVVKIGGGLLKPGNCNPHFGILEASTALGSCMLSITNGPWSYPTASFYISGISAGSHSYDFAGGDTNVTTHSTLSVGYVTDEFSDGFGPAFIEIWAAP